MNPYERRAIGILLLVAGSLVFLLAFGFLVFVCVLLIIDAGVGRVVGIAGLIGIALALAWALREWIRTSS